VRSRRAAAQALTPSAGSAISLGAYGAWALRTLGGADAFDSKLPARWSRVAYVYFPIVGGVISSTSSAGRAGALLVLALAPAVLADVRPSWDVLSPSWPPSPFTLALALPLVHYTYTTTWTRTATRVVGSAEAARLAAPPPPNDIGARIQNAGQAGSVAGVAQALLKSSLGRDTLGALAAPLCAAGVGSALLRLGRGSALVRAVLGVGAETHEWGAGEPVWWRNALGLGVCVVVSVRSTECVIGWLTCIHRFGMGSYCCTLGSRSARGRRRVCAVGPLLEARWRPSAARPLGKRHQTLSCTDIQENPLSGNVPLWTVIQSPGTAAVPTLFGSCSSINECLFLHLLCPPMQAAEYIAHKHHTSHDNDNDGRLLVRSDHASASATIQRRMHSNACSAVEDVLVAQLRSSNACWILLPCTALQR
jgi:hypothetical protein